MTDAAGPTPLPTAVTASGRGGSIYDLGYRRYEGPRLGRAYAVRSLTIDSFRTAYGIGHGGRAKVAPVVLGALAILPAVVVLGVLTLATRLGAREQLEAATPIGYDTYYRSIDAIIALFCAAQAPELLSRDQRHGVLASVFRPRPPPVGLRSRPDRRLRPGPPPAPAPARDDPLLRPGPARHRHRRPRSPTTCRSSRPCSPRPS